MNNSKHGGAAVDGRGGQACLLHEMRALQAGLRERAEHVTARVDRLAARLAGGNTDDTQEATMDQRAAIYTRTATPDAGRQDQQAEACRAYCGREGWPVVATLADVASGGDLDRPGLGAALELAAAGQYETLVVQRPDRLTRSLANLETLQSDLHAMGVQVVYAEGT